MGDSDECWGTIDDGDDCWETIDDDEDDYYHDGWSFGDEKSDNEEVSAEVIQTFTCLQPGCSKIFSSRFKLVRHIIIHSGGPRFKCASCDSLFYRKSQYKEHLEVHKPQRQINKKKIVRAEAAKPTEAVKPAQVAEAAKPAEAVELISCMQPECPEKFSSRVDLEKHIVFHSRSFKCPRCDCCFDLKDQFKNHLEQCIRDNYKP